MVEKTAYPQFVVPRHKASFALTHNAHKDYYETVAETLENGPYYEGHAWASLEERQRAIDSDSLWTMHWYPETPVGFNVVHASSLEAIMAWLAAQDD